MNYLRSLITLLSLALCITINLSAMQQPAGERVSILLRQYGSNVFIYDESGKRLTPSDSESIYKTALRRVMVDNQRATIVIDINHEIHYTFSLTSGETYPLDGHKLELDPATNIVYLVPRNQHEASQ